MTATPLLLGVYKKINSLNKCNEGTPVFFLFVFFCALVAKYVFLCLFPALLFAVSPAD